MKFNSVTKVIENQWEKINSYHEKEKNKNKFRVGQRCSITASIYQIERYIGRDQA